MRQIFCWDTEVVLKILNLISDFRKEQSFYCLVVCHTRSRADQQWDEDVHWSLTNVRDIFSFIQATKEFQKVSGFLTFLVSLSWFFTKFIRCDSISLIINLKISKWKHVFQTISKIENIHYTKLKAQKSMPFIYPYYIRAGWWISEVCADRVRLKQLYIETAVQKDFSQKSIFAREITFEKWPKKWEIVIFS